MASRKKPSLFGALADLRADFRMAKESRFTSRLTGVASTGSGADYHYATERHWLHMLERARHYQRDDCVVGQAVRRLVANVVQDGFSLDPQTGDDGLDAELKLRWQEWAEDPDLCHSEGELTFTAIEQLTLSHMIVDGDLLHLPLASGSLQPVEAHRLRTPSGTKRNVIHGVLLEEDGRRKQYWITKEDVDPRRAVARVNEIEPRDARDPVTGQRQVLHIYHPQRFSQRRGVTALAPVSDIVGMHDDVQFASLVKAQMAALIAILHERDGDWQPMGDQQKGDRTTETLGGGFTRTIEGVHAGLEVFGDPGEKLSTFSANVPSPEFFPHTTLLLTFIAINLDLPVAVLMLDPSNTNFSGWRGAIDQARLRFRQLQKHLIHQFHGPVYRWKLRQWIAQDAALAGAESRNDVRLFAHRWNPPTFRYIEPLTDASADLLQQRNGLQSPRRLQAARGQDWDEVSTEIVQDNARAIRKAIQAAAEINAESGGEQVHWRELLSLPTPDGVQISLSPAVDAGGNHDAADKQASSRMPTFGGRLNGRVNGRPADILWRNGHA